MTGVVTKEKTEPSRSWSASMSKTYWRMHLYNTLLKPSLLTAVEIGRGSLRFVTKTWDEYWADVPKIFQNSVSSLRKTWNDYIDSGFNLSFAETYSDAYMDLLRNATKREDSAAYSCRTFLSKVLGFENFVLKLRGAPAPFAAATSSFRNPPFLSSRCLCLRKHNRNDPSLLALVVGRHEDIPMLFYHYRKQRILRNTDESLLFFPAVDRAVRPQSFRGLEALTEKVVSEWDSRIEQRSRLLADKVLVPILRNTRVEEERKKGRALRILDIGSGAGLFTSKVVSAIVKSGVLGNRKVELSLLDIVSVDSNKHFNNHMLLPSLARVEHILSDYIEWFRTKQPDHFQKFDIAFLFRILHNMSSFRISATQPEAENSRLAEGRYRIFPHLSDYYHAILLLFPELAGKPPEKIKGSPIFCPNRIFNPASLLTPNGRSVIERLSEISTGVLVEDGDLSPEVLVGHMSWEVESDVRVYDFSRALRLSVNHVYWITESRNDLPLRGEMIWPN